MNIDESLFTSEKWEYVSRYNAQERKFTHPATGSFSVRVAEVCHLNAFLRSVLGRRDAFYRSCATQTVRDQRSNCLFLTTFFVGKDFASGRLSKGRKHLYRLKGPLGPLTQNLLLP